MKKVFLPALASAILLASCSEVASGLLIDPSEMDSIEVVFQFNPYSFEPMTKANVGIAELSTRLDVWIIDGTDTVKVHQFKTDAPEGFGTVSATLNKTKTYTVYAVAHKGSGEASIDEESVISFADDKITETFFYGSTFCPDDDTELSCLMRRIVGKFILQMDDAIPDEVTKIRFTTVGGGLKFDAENEVSTGVEDRVSTIAIASRLESGTKFSVYTIGADATSTSTVTITAEALTDEDVVVETHVFTSVPVKCGYAATYHGNFFVTQGMSLSFTAPDSWSNLDGGTY